MDEDSLQTGTDIGKKDKEKQKEKGYWLQGQSFTEMFG